MTRIFLARGSRFCRTHHLSLTEPAGEHRRKSLAFRDHLRANPLAAEEHRDLKRELIRAFAEDRASYTAGKDRFIERAVRSALAEPLDLVGEGEQEILGGKIPGA